MGIENCDWGADVKDGSGRFAEVCIDSKGKKFYSPRKEGKSWSILVVDFERNLRDYS